MRRKVIARTGKGLPVLTPPKEKKNRDWKLTYRSNLKGIIDLMNEIKLEDKHIEALKRTPFWLLQDVIRRKKIDYTTCQKKDDFIERLIGMYRGKHCFQVGKTKRRLTKDNVQVILGIQCSERDMELVHGSKREVDLVKRRRLKAEKVVASNIKTLVKSLVGKKNKTKEDIEDVAKLPCMFLCVTFLFSTSGNRLSWAHIQYFDDLNEMKEYDWAYEVLESLIQSIEKQRRTPKKVTGCMNLLLYWFCEHTKVIETIEGEEIPRLLKWNITDMQKKHEQNCFDENQYDEVLTAICPTPEECKLYGIDTARKNKEHAKSCGSEDDNVGGSDDNDDEDEEDEAKEEDEANGTNQLDESQLELTVRLGDTPKESVDIAKEPAFKSQQPRDEYQNTSSDYQTTTSPMETVSLKHHFYQLTLKDSIPRSMPM